MGTNITPREAYDAAMKPAREAYAAAMKASREAYDAAMKPAGEAYIAAHGEPCSICGGVHR